MTAVSPPPAETGQPVTLVPRAVSRHDLSPIQQKIWTSQRLAPSTALSNMGKTHRISGFVDPARLTAAFDTVVRRSDALRTVVDDRPSAQPQARVLADPPATTTVVDLDPESLHDWCTQRISRPIDLATCAYDSVLLRHAADDWTWWLGLHHVVTDAWSSMRVFELVSEEYLRSGHRETGESGDQAGTGANDGHESGAFDDSPSPQPSFYEHVETDRLSNAAEGSETTPLTPFGGSAVRLTPYGPLGAKTTSVTLHPLSLDGDLTSRPDRYRTFSRELGTVALTSAAMAVTLHRLSGATTVTIGVPVHHRSGPANAAIVGPLMEIYPISIEVDPAGSFGSLFDHAHTQLLTMLKESRRTHAPDVAVDAIVNAVTASYGDFAGLPCATEWYRPTHVEPNHPIRLHVFDYGEGARLELEVNDGLSRDGTHRSFPAHLVNVLEAALRDPETVVDDVDLLTPDDLDVLDALNPPALDPALVAARETPVHEQIASRLRARPDRIVADHDQAELSAGELDERAEALAHWLRSNGVRPGDRVGIRLPRSLDVLMSVHGVLRAGGAFVMLDPDDPTERHDAIISSADIAVVIDQLPDDLEQFPRTDGALEPVGLDDLAYVIFTSGSTGKPKGVPISHRGLADYLSNSVAAYATTSDFVMPMHSALIFDLSITSMFLPQLMNGRTVIVGGDPVSALGRIAADRRITVLKATPSQLEILSRLADEPLALEVAIVGGEAFRRPVAAALAACAPGVRIFNEYGPAEAVVGCMLHEWDPATDLGIDVPIGRATPGARVYILDDRQRRLPVGAWGELYVARTGMTEGYLGLPAATAEKFGAVDRVDDSVLYRTGDRVRVEGDIVVYGGRIDDQLSVSGVRLEPGEIEAALTRRAGVTNAIVRVWSPGSEVVVRCERCGLGTDVPGITIDDAGICTTCREYDRIEPQTRTWFRDEADLDDALRAARARSSGEYDCLHLLSGGKDSTYALYQLVERGWRVHALTLDNGFISEGAKENVRRSIADLGVTHEFVTTDAMNEIFRDSLDRFANVCNGCYKTIYTLATARAHEMGIPVIVTGLSRGQFFETRLLPHQFEADRFDPDEIDRTVIQARRAYHQTRDAVTELLPEHAIFERTDIDVLSEIEYLDFFRYVDVELAEMYDFLENRAPWVRPDDTGRSTNCLVNVAGIETHLIERGYHNYAEPYSWDVRLGHKTRAEALDELDDDIDPAETRPMLDEIGYRPTRPEVLTAWYQTEDGRPIDPRLLASHLRDIVPARAVPTAFVHVADLPIADSTKVDVSALPAPSVLHVGSATYLAPTTPTEAIAADIWAAVLGVDRVGAHDDFFDLGGASLLALEVVAAAERRFDVELPDALVFQHRRLDDFALAVDEQLGTATSLAVIADIEPGTAPPLTPAEEAILFEYRADPTDVRYNGMRHYVVDADVDPGRLRAAIETVIKRHGPLHTAYDTDRTRLTVEQALTFEALPDGSIDEFLDHERGVPFDLDHGPLVRVQVGQRADGWHIALALHHITLDAGTFDILWSEIDAAYHDRPLPPLLTSYAAHGAWQRSMLSEQSFPDVATEEFVGVELPTPVPRLHDDTRAPDGYLHRAASVSTSELTSAASTTPFAAALAAASVVLSAYSRDGVVELGVTASTKDHPAAEPLVGCFLNSLPVTVDLSDVETLAAVDDLAGRTVAGLMERRTRPFADVVRSAREAGARVPNISHMLAYERLAPASFGDTTASHRKLPAPTAITDLTFFVQERGDTIEVGLEFRGSVVSEPLAVDLLSAFDDVLTSLCRQPGLTVAEARARLAASDLHGSSLVAHPPTVVDRIIEVASTSGASIAVTDQQGRSLSYRELLDRATGLADGILSTARHARRVGVALPRSTGVVEAMIGTWLAGATYVPIDPAAAPDRRQAIVEAAKLDAVIVDASTQTLFDGVPTIDVNRISPASQRRRVRLNPDYAAYVIFTSGSTGVPAGVSVSHRNLAASTAARADVYRSAAPERFLVTPSIGFDSSLVGLVWPLVSGGTVVLPADDAVHDVDRLGDSIEQLGVTHLLMVPSLYDALLRRRADRLTGLATVIVAGEACHAGLVAAHHDALPDVPLVNEYGPTEATVWASSHHCTAGHDPVPIGRPIPGTRLRVADAAQQPVGRGGSGELLIAGPGIVDGYISGRTNERFVDDGTERWYRTGDLVRADDDGQLFFLGRVDDQLNVGGLRLEPIEVEAVLRDVDGIDDAAVVAADIDGRPSIVAHLVGDPSRAELTAVRDHVVGKLGPAAAPRRLAFHDSLPLTPNGKLDRRRAALLPHAGVATHAALTTPAAQPSPGATPGVNSDPGPVDESVDAVVSAWRRAFGRDDIDETGDFFTLGGDSLTAVALVSALGDLAGREVAIAELLSATTPTEMSKRLDITIEQTEQATQSTSAPTHAPADPIVSVVTMRPGSDSGPTVVFTPSWDDVMGYRVLADAFPDEVRVLAATIAEPTTGSVAPIRTVDELSDASIGPVVSALAGRTDRPIAVVGWSIGGVAAYDLAQRLAASSVPNVSVVLVDTYFPGEQLHRWINRWSKYKSLLKPGAFGEIGREATTMARRRVNKLATRFGRKLLAWGGEPVTNEPVATTGLRVPAGALDDQPRDTVVPVTLFAANTTNRKRTAIPWRTVAPNLRVVPIVGRHRGFDSIMGADRVDQLIDDLVPNVLGIAD